MLAGCRAAVLAGGGWEASGPWSGLGRCMAVLRSSGAVLLHLPMPPLTRAPEEMRHVRRAARRYACAEDRCTLHRTSNARRASFSAPASWAPPRSLEKSTTTISLASLASHRRRGCGALQFGPQSACTGPMSKSPRAGRCSCAKRPFSSQPVLRARLQTSSGYVEILRPTARPCLLLLPCGWGRRQSRAGRRGQGTRLRGLRGRRAHDARCRAGRTPVPLSSASSPSHHITPCPRPRSTSSSQQRLPLLRTRSRNAGPHPGCAAEPAMAAPAPEPTLLEAAEQEAPVSSEARGPAQQGVEQRSWSAGAAHCCRTAARCDGSVWRSRRVLLPGQD